MKYYGKAAEVAAKIVEAFKSGTLPKALAPVLIRRKDGVPCRSWSWNNQLLCILDGTEDARGIKQWNEVGRTVKKGAKCFHILVPLMKTITAIDPQTGKEKKRQALYGFGTAPVFAVESTEGRPLAKNDLQVSQWLESLPLIEGCTLMGARRGRL